MNAKLSDAYTYRSFSNIVGGVSYEEYLNTPTEIVIAILEIQNQENIKSNRKNGKRH